MRYEASFLTSRADGLPISVLTLFPDGAPVGIVQIAHGMSEYKERYKPFMEYLATRGYVVVVNDHRGHGQSVRSREDLGYFYKGGAEGLLDDLRQVSERIAAQYPQLPLFLFGHSMGSLAVRAYASRWDGALSGLIVCGSPGRNPGAVAGKALAKVIGALRGAHGQARILSLLTFGTFAKKIPNARTEFDWICTDPVVVDAYIADELCGFPFAVNGYIALFTLMQLAYETVQAQNPALPVHFISGAEDACALGEKGFADAVERFRARGYRDVSAKMYPGLRHEILNEPAHMQIFEDIYRQLEAWLRKETGE